MNKVIREERREGELRRIEDGIEGLIKEFNVLRWIVRKRIVESGKKEERILEKRGKVGLMSKIKGREKMDEGDFKEVIEIGINEEESGGEGRKEGEKEMWKGIIDEMNDGDEIIGGKRNKDGLKKLEKGIGERRIEGILGVKEGEVIDKERNEIFKEIVEWENGNRCRGMKGGEGCEKKIGDFGKDGWGGRINKKNRKIEMIKDGSKGNGVGGEVEKGKILKELIKKELMWKRIGLWGVGMRKVEIEEIESVVEKIVEVIGNIGINERIEIIELKGKRKRKRKYEEEFKKIGIGRRRRKRKERERGERNFINILIKVENNLRERKYKRSLEWLRLF